ncbi:MAG: hypothetical protein LBG78_04655, partial [Azoarcus sp.]|jgi:hypothetical protein|nr:hypothetical protein [Azoarcus sp.]
MLFLCLPSISIASDNTLPDDAVTKKEKILQSSGYDDISAEFPLRVLLSNSNKVIPKKKSLNYKKNLDSSIYWKLLPEKVAHGVRKTEMGTCNYDMGQRGQLTIKDLLISPLAGLVYGKSAVIGQCFGEENKECYIEITHAFNEVVYGYEIRFKTQKNKLLMDSLWCVNTP